MNTTEVGDIFEKEVYAFFEDQIRNHQFMVLPECCKLHHKKGYYSRQRESFIIFDIAIEVYRPGETSYSILILIECKKYQHSVPVSDVEEFFAKVQQVGAANTKAIIVSSNSFQEGGIKFARSNGIGLVRYFKNSDLKWVLNRSPSTLRSASVSSSLDVKEGLIQESYRSRIFDLYCYAGDTFSHSLSQFLPAVVGSAWELIGRTQSSKKRRRLVEFLSTEQIEASALAVLMQLGYRGGQVPLESILQGEAEEGLQYVQEAPPCDMSGEVLGRISFSPLRITVYQDGKTLSERQRFTLAHELGHYFLKHGRYMAGEVHEISDDIGESGRLPELHDVQRLEWQANYFASCLLLPREHLSRSFHAAVSLVGIANRGFGPLYVDEQQCNQQAYYLIAGTLAKAYAVSLSVVRVRLIGLGLLNDNASSLFRRLGIAEARIFHKLPLWRR